MCSNFLNHMYPANLVSRCLLSAEANPQIQAMALVKNGVPADFSHSASSGNPHYRSAVEVYVDFAGTELRLLTNYLLIFPSIRLGRFATADSVV